MPPPAMASPPQQSGLPPKPQTSKPSKTSQDSIRHQFREAKRSVTRPGDATENARRRKRKQKEDGRQLFITAKAMAKRLARAARRSWKFFWEREMHAAPSQDMHLDPRYANWYPSSPDSGADDYNRVTTSPANFDSSSLNL